MEFLAQLSFNELLMQLPSYLADSLNMGDCIDFILSKLGEDSWDDVSNGRVLKMMAKELRGRRGIVARLVQELLPLLSRPYVLIEHLSLFISEDNLSEITFLVETLRQMVKEDRGLVMTVLGAFGDLASLLAAAAAHDLHQGSHIVGRKKSLFRRRPADQSQAQKLSLNFSGQKAAAVDALAPAKLSFLELQDIRNEIFAVCIDSIELVDVADMPTLIRTLLFALTNQNASRGLMALRESTQKFSAAEMAPILPVLYTSLRLSPQLGTAFLTFCTNHSSFTLLDLYFFVIILESPTPSLVAEAWKVLDEAFSRKRLNLALLRAFALDSAEFLHLSEGVSSQNVLFSMSEHLMHAPNPVWIDMGADLAVLLFHHFPSLRLQILDTLLSTSSHAIAQPFLMLDPRLLGSSPSRASSASNGPSSQSNHDETYRQAVLSLDMWRFPMRAVLELCATQPKFVAPLYLSIEDSLLQWSHKGQSVLIEKLLPHERRHLVSHIHCMAKCLVFLAPFQSSLFGTLMMLIQKQTCSSNPLAQACGIVVAHHVIQAGWTQKADRHFITSHLLRTCPHMTPAVRTLFYELVCATAPVLDEDDLRAIHSLVLPAIRSMNLIRPSKTIQEWDLKGFALWTCGTRAKRTLPSHIFEGHAIALLKCHLSVLNRLDQPAYQLLMGSKLHLDQKHDWEAIEGRSTKMDEKDLGIVAEALEISFLSLMTLNAIVQVGLESQIPRRELISSPNDMDPESYNSGHELQQDFLSCFSSVSSIPLHLENAIIELSQLRNRLLVLFRSLLSNNVADGVKDTKKSKIPIAKPHQHNKLPETREEVILPFNIAMSLINSSNTDAVFMGLEALNNWCSYVMVVPELMDEFNVSRFSLFSHRFHPAMWPNGADTSHVQTFTTSVISQLPAHVLGTSDSSRPDIPGLLLRQGATSSGSSAIFKYLVSGSFSLQKSYDSKLIPVMLRLLRGPNASAHSLAPLAAINVLAHLVCFSMQLDTAPKSAASLPLLSSLLASFSSSLGTSPPSERLMLQSTLEHLGSIVVSVISRATQVQCTQIAACFVLYLLSRVNQPIAARLPQALESLLKRAIDNDLDSFNLCQNAIYWPLLLSKQNSLISVSGPDNRITLALISLAQSQLKWPTWRQLLADAITELHEDLANSYGDASTCVSHPVYRFLNSLTLLSTCNSMISNLGELCCKAVEAKRGRRSFSSDFTHSFPNPLPAVVNLIKQAHALIFVIGQNGEVGVFAEWRLLVKNWLEHLKSLVWASIEWRRLSVPASKPTLGSSFGDEDKMLDVSQNEEEDEPDSASSLLSDVFAQSLHLLHELIAEISSMQSEAERLAKAPEKRHLGHIISRIEKLQSCFLQWSKRYHVRVNLDYSQPEPRQLPPMANRNTNISSAVPPPTSASTSVNSAVPTHISGFQASQLPDAMKQVVTVMVARKKPKASYAPQPPQTNQEPNNTGTNYPNGGQFPPSNRMEID